MPMLNILTFLCGSRMNVRQVTKNRTNSGSFWNRKTNYLVGWCRVGPWSDPVRVSVAVT